MVTNHDYRRFAILYVDDETQALKYFRKALEKDFEILTAENVAEAEEVLKEHGEQIGILVCDQRMPGERGTDLLARVRKDRPGARADRIPTWTIAAPRSTSTSSSPGTCATCAASCCVPWISSSSSVSATPCCRKNSVSCNA